MLGKRVAAWNAPQQCTLLDHQQSGITVLNTTISLIGHEILKPFFKAGEL